MSATYGGFADPGSGPDPGSEAGAAAGALAPPFTPVTFGSPTATPDPAPSARRPLEGLVRLRGPVSEQVGLARYWWAHQHRQARARWYLRGASSVGREAAVYGRPLIEASDLEIGDHFLLWSGYRRTMISGWGRIQIGNRCFINSGVVLFSAVDVALEDDVAIANEVYLTDTNSHGVEGQPCVSAPVRIGAGSWIGARAIVLPGVEIGARSVVGAGAVVSEDIPAESLVVGNPGKVVRRLHYPPRVTRAWHG